MKTNGEIKETPMTLKADERPKICYCDDHWSEIMTSILENGLGDHVARTDEELDRKLRMDSPDPGIHITAQLTTSALQSFGIDHILRNKGCPVCTYKNIINIITEGVALQYLEKH